MGTLGCREVKALLSLVRGHTRSFLGSAAAQPRKAGSEDGADLAEVRRQVGIRRQRSRGIHHAATIYRLRCATKQ